MRARHDPAYLATLLPNGRTRGEQIAGHISARAADESKRLSGMVDFMVEQARYENVADYRAACDAERAARQAAVDALIDDAAYRHAEQRAEQTGVVSGWLEVQRERRGAST